MPVLPRMYKFGLLRCVCACTCLLFSRAALVQQTTLGSIVGHMRVVRGDTPPQPVLVSLELHGAPMDSAYSDSSGTFGFHALHPDPYYVVINDEDYEPVSRLAVIDPIMMSPVVYLDITLIPRKKEKPASNLHSNSPGSNSNMIDIREFSTRFPRAAVKEFKKGVQSDREGKRDEAIRHYQKAIAIAPYFYVARNNLGSDYLGNSDFPAARKEFEEVVRLNQSDADAYFNLSNVCMLTGQLPEAKQYLDEGMRRQPESALGQFLLGSLNLRLKKLPEAETALRRAIQLDPLMAQARLQLVNLLLQQGRKEDAESLLRDFLSAFPESPFSAQAKQVLQRLEGSAKIQSVPN
jgi:tetratricopeptide (TPR) repeat protein